MEKIVNNGDNRLLFYNIMNYPIPKNKELFFLINDFRDKHLNISKIYDAFSWDNHGEIIDEYIKKINKYGWIYRAIPFVKNIYLCNSITFNGLKQDSDIDLFFIVKKGKLWTARFFSVFLFTIFGLRWFGTKKPQKFDLGFFITDDNLNLYSFTIKPFDIYFIYWIAHLVPLYSQNILTQNDIYTENRWIKNLLQNHPLTTVIDLGNKKFDGNNFFKKMFEKLLNGFWGKQVEKLIKYFWMPIVLVKKQRLGKSGAGIVVSDSTLKFYGSKVRKIVNHNFNFVLKHIEKDTKNNH